MLETKLLNVIKRVIESTTEITVVLNLPLLVLIFLFAIIFSMLKNLLLIFLFSCIYFFQITTPISKTI